VTLLLSPELVSKVKLCNRAFAAAQPGQWNSLPTRLKDADLSYNEFWQSLKTFLFGQWGHGAV